MQERGRWYVCDGAGPRLQDLRLFAAAFSPKTKFFSPLPLQSGRGCGIIFPLIRTFALRDLVPRLVPVERREGAEGGKTRRK